MSKMRSLLGSVACALAAIVLATGIARAEPLPQPQGKVMLDVTGQIKNRNSGEKASFDLAMLEGLGRTKLVTSTAWTEGRPEFEGVLLSTLIERVGASGTTAIAIALNDYKVDIPMQDFSKYRGCPAPC